MRAATLVESKASRSSTCAPNVTWNPRLARRAVARFLIARSMMARERDGAMMRSVSLGLSLGGNSRCMGIG